MIVKIILTCLGAAIVVIGALLFVQSRHTGYVEVEGEGITVQLQKGWIRTVTVKSGTEPTELSVGRYKLQSVEVVKKQGNDTWRIHSFRPLRNKVNVRKAETTVVKLGPPFVVKPFVYNKRGGVVSIDFTVVGQAGEYYQRSAKKNTRSTELPSVSIIDEAGETLASGKFQYG